MTGNNSPLEQDIFYLGRFDTVDGPQFAYVRTDEIVVAPDGDAVFWAQAMRLNRGERFLGRAMPLAGSAPLAPLSASQRVFAVALNFHTHVGETRNHPTESPIVFYKPPSAFAGHDGCLRPPAGFTDQFDYEGEVGVVIGKACSGVEERDALDYVLGITGFMDGTARDRLRVKAGDRVFLDWLSAKGADRSSLIGPYIACGPKVLSALKARTIRLETTLNGQVVQEGSIADLIFPVETLISFLSKFMVLLPGDIIAIGTPGGIGLARGRLLQQGDTVAVTISLVPPLVGVVG